MTIKEVETLSGLPRANIRYYESEGLIAPKRAENGYREYSQADIDVLLRVKLLRALGLRIDTIKSLAEEGTTMILVTHEIGFAREVASRILFMDGGKIAADGTPEEIIDHPENQRLQQFLNFVNRK